MLNSPIDEIKNRLDIVDIVQGYIKLQKTGANWRACCPFHSEKTPSFFVSPTRQIFKCFGCGAGGNIFEFVMKMEGVEFVDALKNLAKKAGVELRPVDQRLQTERQRLFEICDFACKFYENGLSNTQNGKKAKEYILGRGISEESIKNWKIGFSPDAWRELLGFLAQKGYKAQEIEKAGLAIRTESKNNSNVAQSNYYDRFRGRIMFPIFDLNGQAVGFGGRVFLAKREGEPKYINTPQTMIYDKSRILYGLNNAKVEIRQKNSCVLVEGYTDVIMSHQADIKNVVAVSGTALTFWQLKIIKHYTENIITCFDMDLAGDTATKRGIDMAIQSGFNVKVVSFDSKEDADKDPADIIKENKDRWQKIIASPKGILDFYFDNAFANFNSKEPEGKKGIAKMLLPALKRMPSKIEQSHWIGVLAGRIGAREDDIIEDLKKISLEEINQPEINDVGVKEFKAVTKEKARREFLEERLLGLAIKTPQRAQEILCDFRFSRPEFQEIFDNLKKQISGVVDFNYKTFRVSLASKLASSLDHVALEEEFIGALDNLDFSQELKLCLRQINIYDLRKKLQELEQEIKKLESEGKLGDDILNEFNLLSRKLMMLEVAGI